MERHKSGEAFEPEMFAILFFFLFQRRTLTRHLPDPNVSRMTEREQDAFSREPFEERSRHRVLLVHPRFSAADSPWTKSMVIRVMRYRRSRTHSRAFSCKREAAAVRSYRRASERKVGVNTAVRHGLGHYWCFMARLIACDIVHDLVKELELKQATKKTTVQL